MIPTKLSIIGRDVCVIMTDDLPDGQLGECDDIKGVIKVKTGTPLPVEADTLLHECVHAVDERFQLKLSERQVYCITVGIMALLKDNESLLRYINDAISEQTQI
jgi:hypothetical protein